MLILLSACGNRFGKDKTEELVPDRFVVGYYRFDNKEFIKDYKGVCRALKNYKIQNRSYLYGSSNYRVAFERDTFDWQAMKQFEPRDGFWIYERGKGPLDLGYDELATVVPKAEKYFNE